MSNNQTILSGLFALFALIPFLIGLLSIKTSGVITRVFLVFLFIGIISDITMWVMISHKEYKHLLLVFNLYSLIECVFFFWMIQKLSKKPILRLLSRIGLALALPFWMSVNFIYPLMVGGTTYSSAPFVTTYEVIVSFLTGYLLLEMIEEGQPTFDSVNFWLILAIFFYCFCTFFLMSFLETIMSQKIWFMNTIINNITYLLYSIALWKLYKARNTA